jgi:hypothetical protein
MARLSIQAAEDRWGFPAKKIGETEMLVLRTVSAKKAFLKAKGDTAKA